MDVKIEKQENSQVLMEIKISAEEIAPHFDVAAKELSKKVNIPGFRQGKIPKSVLVNYIGEAAIFEEAAKNAVPEAYLKAIAEYDVDVVAKPELEVTDFGEDKSMSFKATVTVKPDVELGQYKGIPVEKCVALPTEEDIDAEIEKARDRLAKMIEQPDDYAIAKDDIVMFDFEGFIDGVPFEGGKAENYALTIGSGNFIEGFEDQLLGFKKGDKKDVEVGFPADYRVEALAGKPALFKVKINSVRKKELPDLNDEFVKDISEELDTLEQLREKVRNDLKAAAEKVASDNVSIEALGKAVENAKLEVPKAMIEQRVDQMLEELARQMQEQGVDLQGILASSDFDTESIREQYRSQAESDIRQELVLDAVMKAENIDITEAEIEEGLANIATRMQQPIDVVRNAFSGGEMQANFYYQLKMTKAADLIFDNALVEEKFVAAEAVKPKTKKAPAKKAAVEGEKKPAPKTTNKENKAE